MLEGEGGLRWPYKSICIRKGNTFRGFTRLMDKITSRFSAVTGNRAAERVGDWSVQTELLFPVSLIEGGMFWEHLLACRALGGGVSPYQELLATCAFNSELSHTRITTDGIQFVDEEKEISAPLPHSVRNLIAMPYANNL